MDEGVDDVAGHPDAAVDVQGQRAGEDVGVGRDGVEGGAGGEGVIGAGEGVAPAVAAVAGEFGLARDEAEHDGLVEAVGRRGARVVAEFEDRVAPGPRAEDVPDVRDGVAEEVALVRGGDAVAQAAAGPGGAVCEEGLDGGDGFLEAFVEGVVGGEGGGGGGGDGWNVVGDQEGHDLVGLGGVDGGDVAGCVDGLADGGVLVVSIVVSMGDMRYASGWETYM